MPYGKTYEEIKEMVANTVLYVPTARDIVRRGGLRLGGGGSLPVPVPIIDTFFVSNPTGFWLVEPLTGQFPTWNADYPRFRLTDFTEVRTVRVCTSATIPESGIQPRLQSIDIDSGIPTPNRDLPFDADGSMTSEYDGPVTSALTVDFAEEGLKASEWIPLPQSFDYLLDVIEDIPEGNEQAAVTFVGAHDIFNTGASVPPDDPEFSYATGRVQLQLR